MPLITVTYSSSRQVPTLKADIAAAVTELTASILHKDPKVTAIIVKSVDAADWFAGGQSLAEQNLASFWLDIHVTEGTNTKDEKAAYIAAVFKRMGELLGPLHNESYLHVDEVRGDAYGFGGLTQERRYIAGKLQVAPKSAAALTHQVLSGFQPAPIAFGAGIFPREGQELDRFRQGLVHGAKHFLESLPERDIDVRRSQDMAEIGKAGHAKARVRHAAGDNGREVGQVGLHIDRDAVEGYPVP
jgi:4-oxalocrotonate tautomerase